MKILYIAHERRAAELAAQALRRIAQDVTLTWTPSAGAAIGWIRPNPDARAMIVEAGAMGLGSELFLEQVRGLGATVPIAVIAPEHLQGLSAALKANLDAVVDRERNRREGRAAAGRGDASRRIPETIRRLWAQVRRRSATRLSLKCFIPSPIGSSAGAMRYFEWAVHLRARMRWCGPPASAAWPYSLDSMKSLGLRRPDRAEGSG
jgi:hypothetical protein